MSRSGAKRRARPARTTAPPASAKAPPAKTAPAPAAPLTPLTLGMRFVGSGWTPAVLVAAATAAMLLAFDVSPLDVGRFADARHFWVSGYSERRVLVEGWAYTTSADTVPLKAGETDRTLAYWNPALLAQNDRAFLSPSETTVGELRDRYGVRWLFADIPGTDSS